MIACALVGLAACSSNGGGDDVSPVATAASSRPAPTVAPPPTTTATATATDGLPPASAEGTVARPAGVPADLEVERFPVPAGSRPHDVAPAPDGSVWYTAQGAGRL